ncbi:MAG: glycosyltransferase [Planctomycetota bacterium]
MNALSLAATMITALVLVPSAVLAIECLAACFPQRRQRFALVRVPRTVVLVPAHNEEDCLPDALRTLEPELAEDDRIVVVAHNCSDRTAMVARARGAEVVEARDAGTGGKPDALKAGLAYLAQDPPEIVVIVDADCRVERGAVRALAMAAAAHGGPVQGDYRFGGEGEFNSVSGLALLVKNVVRPLGLTRLGLPCLLNGAGSAYPFEQLRAAPHGEGSIAEDYQLAIDLARAGHPTVFVPEARVRSVLPGREDAALRQRRRWEHGHLALVLRTAPWLIVEGLRNRSLFFLGVDLLVPPLAFLVLALLGALALGLADRLVTGSSTSLVLAVSASVVLAGGLGGALVRFLGAASTLRFALAVPAYVLRKLPLYLGFFKKRETRWQKTERTSAPGPRPAEERHHGRTGTDT